jgi:hypothetical protein
MIRNLSLVFAVLLLGSVAIRADSVVTIQPAGTDSVSWVQLGPSFTNIPQAFNFTTGSGVNVNGSIENGGGQIRQQWDGWAGNFATGTQVLWNEGHGILTLNFAQGYDQVGAQIQADIFGTFVAQICDAYGCVTENGVSTSSNDNSAIYLGITGNRPIDWVTFSLLDTDSNDFAIGNLTLGGGSPVATPEPGSLLLLGTGLASLATVCRRRFVRQH